MKTWHVWTVFIIFLLIWLTSFVWFPVLARFSIEHFPPSIADVSSAIDPVARYGAVGDWFGAVNSLFSGLALAGVALTLFLQSRATRRTSKPLLHPFVDETSDPIGGAAIERFSILAGQVALPLVITFTAKNVSQDVALETEYTIDVDETVSSGVHAIGEPLAQGVSKIFTKRLILVGNSGNKFVARIASKHARITFIVDYVNVEGLKFRTKCAYLVSASDSDLEALRVALSQDESTNSAWGGGKRVVLELKLERDSWKWAPPRGG